MSRRATTAIATVPSAPADPAPSWHALAVPDVLDVLETSPDGLDAAAVEERRRRDGLNELIETGSTEPLRLLWEQLSAVMVLILIGAAALSAALGKFLEAGTIGAIVVLFALLGFLQEYRAERAIAALRQLSSPVVRVVRGGSTTEVLAPELVRGDVVVLDAGSVVPADLRLIEQANLRVQEAALTGESEPVDKRVEPVAGKDVPLGDRTNLAFSGTQVTAGRGRGVVTGVGMQTELGRIATLLQSVEAERTPLQERLDAVGRQLALVGVVVAAVVAGLGALGGEAAGDLLLTAISVAVAVIPEGLPAVVTFTLAIGAQRMLRRQALIRRLPAVETLGSVTTICSDKTGTLTQNRMTVTVVDVANHRAERTEGGGLEGADRDVVVHVLAAGALCNDGEILAADDGETRSIGDPTETAIVAAAIEAGLDVDVLRRAMPRVAENPFDSDRKRMSTLHAAPDPSIAALRGLTAATPVAFVKGAVDGMLAHTTHVWDHGVAVGMDEGWRERILAANEQMAASGMRVLAVAYREVGGPNDVGVAEDDLTLLGLVAMIDPPRDEVRDAVATCWRAGIRPVMITGDHPATALAIARDLGIADADGRVVTGAEIERMDQPSLDQAVREVAVFARVSPEHKLRIVASLQEQDQVVAMTGDGVNDAPALKRADIGVAMGITGTDVSKEASEMVLRDDNFATIVAAVEEGRVIYDNLRRFVSFAVAGNLGKILVMVGWGLVFLLIGTDGVGDAVALLPLQLLWLNLMTDGVLGLAMGTEPAERTVMQRPPHRPGSSIWAGGLGGQTAWVGVVIGVIALAIGVAYHETGRDEWQTMMFTSIAFLQVGQAIGTRSHRDSIRAIGFTTNRLAVAAVAFVVALQLVALYTPVREFLDLAPLGVGDLALCVGSGIALLAGLELAKARTRRRADPAVPVGRRPSVA